MYKFNAPKGVLGNLEALRQSAFGWPRICETRTAGTEEATARARTRDRAGR